LLLLSHREAPSRGRRKHHPTEPPRRARGAFAAHVGRTRPIFPTSAWTAIALPLAWLDAWEVSLTRSETLYGEIEKARTARRTHVSAGQDAETEFVEICVRLRRYVGSRASSSDKARVAEGKTLLAPLLDAMARLRATAAARATLRENEKKPAAPVAPAAPSEGQPS
jgi:hypothetical protein